MPIAARSGISNIRWQLDYQFWVPPKSPLLEVPKSFVKLASDLQWENSRDLRRLVSTVPPLPSHHAS